MNRREFLTRMGALGLVVASPKLIFDMGANKSKYYNEVKGEIVGNTVGNTVSYTTSFESILSKIYMDSIENFRSSMEMIDFRV